MIEDIIINYLIGQTLSVGTAVYAEKPVAPPDEYILVEKTGSGRDDQIDRAMIAIQSISKSSLLRAAQINEEVKATMYGIVQLPEIFACKLNSDYNFTDTKTKEYRYQAVFNLFY